MFLEKIMILGSEDTDYVRSCKIKGSNKEEVDEEMNMDRDHIFIKLKES